MFVVRARRYREAIPSGANVAQWSPAVRVLSACVLYPQQNTELNTKHLRGQLRILFQIPPAIPEIVAIPAIPEILQVLTPNTSLLFSGTVL